MAVFLDCQRELRSVRTFAFISLLVAAVCVALVYVLIWFFSKKAIEPTVRSVEKQKQFITDASHELKTPLTVIATSLTVLEMEVGPQRWIDKIRGQTAKLTELVGDLVTLARMDEENPPLRISDFDISGAVAEAAGSFRDYAAANGHTLEIDVAPGMVYHGDEYAVRQMVSILLDNAVKYADSGGAIRLSLERGRKGVVLKTSNPCAGRNWTGSLTAFTGRTAPGPSGQAALAWACPSRGASRRPTRAPSGRNAPRRASSNSPPLCGDRGCIRYPEHMERDKKPRASSTPAAFGLSLEGFGTGAMGRKDPQRRDAPCPLAAQNTTSSGTDFAYT